MSKVFHKLFYHAIWATYRREPIITSEIESYLYPFFENKAKRFHCNLIAVGGIADHIHIAIRIPPAESVSDIIGKLKGSSSYFLNKEIQITENFAWQDGFGVLSFSERDLPAIVDYIKNQKAHHRNGTCNEEMERMEEDDDSDESSKQSE
jgi:putative transposase